MRKRSKYRPKKILANPVGYVLESLTPLVKHDDALINLKVKNHYALTSLTQGKAGKADMDVLINMANMTEALYRLGFGTEYKDIIALGNSALLAVSRRGAESNRFILKSEEMKALNQLVDLHDAQLEIINVKDVEKAIAIVENERRQRRMINIVERK